MVRRFAGARLVAALRPAALRFAVVALRFAAPLRPAAARFAVVRLRVVAAFFAAALRFAGALRAVVFFAGAAFRAVRLFAGGTVTYLSLVDGIADHRSGRPTASRRT